MTPNDLEVLWHFHVSGTPHPRRTTPAVKTTIRWLLENDLIYEVDNEGSYETTPRGRAHLAQIQALPLPRPATERWIGADGKII